MGETKHLLHGYLAAIATLLMWSGFSLVSRMGGKSLLTAYDVFALRVIFATVILLPFAGSMPKRFFCDRRIWVLIIFCSLIYCPFVYSGFKYAPAAHGGILLAGMQPFLISVVVWLLNGTRPGKWRSVGLVFISIGILCAAMPYFSKWSNDSVLGDLLLLSSSISWAFYGVLAARWGYSAWTLTRAIAYGSALVYLPVYFFYLPKELAAAPWATIITQGVYQGLVATIFAMLTYLKAISILGAERAAAFLALVPIVTGIVAVPLLDEPLTGWLLSALAFVSLGSYIAARYGATPTRT